MLASDEVIRRNGLLVFGKISVLKFYLHGFIKQLSLVIPSFFIIDHSKIDKGCACIFNRIQNSELIDYKYTNRMGLLFLHSIELEKL